MTSDDGDGDIKTYFHMHLISDSTGETLTAVSRAATAMEGSVTAIEHLFPMVRSLTQLDEAFQEISQAPGIVMHTFVDDILAAKTAETCERLGLPSIPVLDPVVETIQNYLNVHFKRKVGGQHLLNSDYFRRIEALNFTMAHDDGLMPDDLETADVILIGVSRTSKTPTSVYLANRGLKTANIPIVPTNTEPHQLIHIRQPLVVGLLASAERIVQIRQNRMAFLDPGAKESDYTDRRSVAQEINHCRRLCARNGWPTIDVTRRSIEETAAEIMSLLRLHRSKMAESEDFSMSEASNDDDDDGSWEHRR